MASGALGGSSATKGTINTAGTQSSTVAETAIDLSALSGNGTGVRVFVTVASTGAALCIGETADGDGGWRVPADDVSYELGIFAPTENIAIFGLAGATVTGAYTLIPATL